MLALSLAAHSGCFKTFQTALKHTPREAVLAHCTYETGDLSSKPAYSLPCLLIDIDDLDSYTLLIKSDFPHTVTNCPIFLGNCFLVSMSFLLTDLVEVSPQRQIQYLEKMVEHFPVEPQVHLTPLYTAMKNFRKGSLRLIQILLEHGANPDSNVKIFSLSFFIGSAVIFLLLQFSNKQTPDSLLQLYLKLLESVPQLWQVPPLFLIEQCLSWRLKDVEGTEGGGEGGKLRTEVVRRRRKVNSLREISRAAVRDWGLEEVESGRSSNLRGLLSGLPLPPSLISFLTFQSEYLTLLETEIT